MVEKAIKPLSGVSAKPLADVAKKASSAQELARQIASVSASTDALKNIQTNLSRYGELAKISQTASEIAKALSGQNELSKLTTSLAASLPKVDLHLPDVSRTIRASLPKPLPDVYLPRPREHLTVPEILPPAQEITVSAAEQDELTIASPEDLGLLVRRAREKRGLSQQRFADLAGVGRRFVSELENGKATLELGKVLKVAHAVGLSLVARSR